MEKHTISLRNAMRGIIVAITSQLNIRIHFTVAIIATSLGIFLQISEAEWLIVMLTVALVIGSELFNTAIEFACNAITREYREDIKNAKDVAAGSVLFSAFFAIIVAIIIFVPKLYNLLIDSLV